MARPSARRAALAVATGNPLVRDFSGGRAVPVRVEFDVRPVYDFVFSLSDEVGETDDLPAADRRWLSSAKADLRARVGEALDLYGSELCIVLAGLAVDQAGVRSAADFVALVDSTPDDGILRVILGEDLRDPETHDLAERALAHDGAAIERLVARQFESHPAARRGRSAMLYRDPGALLRPAREVLAAWLGLFQPVEARVATMIERDVELRANDRRSLGPIELIERTTGGIRWLSEPGVTRVILAPSYFTRPYNFVLAAGDWRMYGYPIADAALDASDPLAPPPAVVRLHRALGDDTRLRILRLLRDRDLYLTEIAQLLELSKPTIKHHLALLRSAGLVTVTEEAGLTYYSLRRERLDDASGDLKHFLLG